MKTGQILRKIRLSPLSRHFHDEQWGDDLKKFDSESTTDITVATSSASLSDLSLGSGDLTDWEENESLPRQVRFWEDENIYEIKSCFAMDPSEREEQWYQRHDLANMKTEARALALGIKKHKGQMVSSLQQSYNQASFMCESGVDEDELIQVGNGSIMENLKPWSCGTVAGEACRGIEKSLLRREREGAIKGCREMVIETTALYKEDSACADMVAAGYSQLSRYAVMFAQSVAQADEIAAREC